MLKTIYMWSNLYAIKCKRLSILNIISFENAIQTIIFIGDRIYRLVNVIGFEKNVISFENAIVLASEFIDYQI